MGCTPISEEKREALETSQESDEVWEQSLYAVCESDSYLSGRFLDISNLLNLLRQEIESKTKFETHGKNDVESISLGDVMRESIQMTSVTNFSADDSTPIVLDEHAWTDMVYSYHEAMTAAISDNNPSWSFKNRRNTGNGGFNFFEPIRLELPFYQIMIDNIPAMQFVVAREWVFTQDEMKVYNENDRLRIINRPDISKAMKDLDEIMLLLANKNDWVEWESIVEYHNESANFSRGLILRAPKVIFKFEDIQRFLDPENIHKMARAIEALVKYELKIAAAMNDVFN